MASSIVQIIPIQEGSVTQAVYPNDEGNDTVKIRLEGWALIRTTVENKPVDAITGFFAGASGEVFLVDEIPDFLGYDTSDTDVDWEKVMKEYRTQKKKKA
jgi:hypothetical protein